MENSPDKITLIKSGDGSHTLYHEGLKETYHSTHGAIQESEHVYIQAGLEEVVKMKSSVRILEVGFGTGLNVWLTLKRIINTSVSIDFTTLEPYPLPEEIVRQLNYAETSESLVLQKLFAVIHESPWENRVQIVEDFYLRKFKQRLEDFVEEENSFDLIYFDAFAPSKQEELWAEENIRKVYALLAPDGILVSYCANGQFKRDLKKVGFKIEALPGPPGKKEITRAIK